MNPHARNPKLSLTQLHDSDAALAGIAGAARSSPAANKMTL
jgi:hypothetical protein